MLLKLIKHELKTSYKFLFLCHAFILLLAVLLTGFLLSPTLMLGMSVAAIALLYICTITASIFGMQIYIGIRFYKNLFTDEGYLMHTLPTTPATLLHSKIITGVIWTCFNALVVAISLGIISISGFMTVDLSFLQLINYYMDITLQSILLLLLELFLCCLASLLKIYGCICLGQLFKKNRVFTSLVAYAGLTFATQFFALYRYSFNTTYSSTATSTSTTNIGYSYPTLIIMIIVFYIMSRYIMKKKVNLV